MTLRPDRLAAALLGGRLSAEDASSEMLSALLSSGEPSVLLDLAASDRDDVARLAAWLFSEVSSRCEVSPRVPSVLLRHHLPYVRYFAVEGLVAGSALSPEKLSIAYPALSDPAAHVRAIAMVLFTIAPASIVQGVVPEHKELSALAPRLRARRPQLDDLYGDELKDRLEVIAYSRAVAAHDRDWLSRLRQGPRDDFREYGKILRRRARSEARILARGERQA